MAQKYEMMTMFLSEKQQVISKTAIQEHLIQLGEEITHMHAYLEEFSDLGILTRTLRGYRLNQAEVFGIGTIGIRSVGGERERIVVPLEGAEQPYICNHSGGDRVVALPGDIVCFRVLDGSAQDMPSATIEAVLVRTERLVIGSFLPSADGDGGYLQTEDESIEENIIIKEARGAQLFDRVAARLTSIRPGMGKFPEAKVETVLGLGLSHTCTYEDVARDYGFESHFTQRSLHQLDKVGERVAERDLDGRTDFTNLCVFTIDGVDAKDLDDAISIEATTDGFRLGVHIADVSHYLKEGSPLDREARQRGTSVYFIDKVIPMLPVKLSNQLCSLNPNELKLTLSVMMEFDTNGNLIRHSFHESYIRSKARLTYEHATAFLKNPKPLSLKAGLWDDAILADIELSLVYAGRLANLLKRNRYERGALNFDFPEASFTLNADGVPDKVEMYERGIANEIIEAFMVITNETVAAHFASWELPFIYRVHAAPDDVKLEGLFQYLRPFGYVQPTTCTPQFIQGLLANAVEQEAGMTVQLLLLQAMKQARYAPDVESHFGLASLCYTHFTSPIRRYPDLQVHRILKDWIHRRLNTGRIEQLEVIVDEVSKVSSHRERQAQKAESAYKRMKEIQYLERHLGQAFQGVISKVGKSECEVILENTIVGTIPYKDSSHQAMFSEVVPGVSVFHYKSNLELKVGDVVKVSPIALDITRATIDFELLS